MEQRKYDDIMSLAHHVSVKRRRMSNADRAAQFAPFAALTGYEAVIRETGRLTDAEAELDECSIAFLDDKLRKIAQEIHQQPLVTFTCFHRDERKQGGAYVQITGRVKRIDETRGQIRLTDGTEIPILSVYEISGEFFG